MKAGNHARVSTAHEEIGSIGNHRAGVERLDGCKSV
jgi:hypothetical protein